MTPSDTDSFIGEIVPNNMPPPEGQCWPENPVEYAKWLMKHSAVVLPQRPDLKLMIVGHQTPGPGDTDKIWFRFDLSGHWIGDFAFIKGGWRRIVPREVGEVVDLIGDAAHPPEGYKTMDGSFNGYPNLSEFFRGSAPTQYYKAMFVGY